MALELKKNVKKLPERRKNLHFNPEIDYIDAIATKTIPRDGPQNVDAIRISADGNCFCRSISHSWIGNESMHLQMRAMIVIEGILNKNLYLDHDFLKRGATYLRDEETLPVLYAQYSDFYVSGQRLTADTVEYIYWREIHDCTKINSYMGLWQIEQAACVLGIHVQSVYPEYSDDIMRHDFNRLFFPNHCENTDDLVMIMRTSIRRNTPPAHFVSLLTKKHKYAT